MNLEEIKERRRNNPWFKTGLVTGADIDWLIAEVERLRRMTPIANVQLSGDAEYWKTRAEKAEAELADCQYWHGKLDEKHEELKAENRRLQERVREPLEAGYRAGVEACKALLVVMDMGSKPRKPDEALTWRENDEMARKLALTAIAEVEGRGIEQALQHKEE